MIITGIPVGSPHVNIRGNIGESSDPTKESRKVRLT